MTPARAGADARAKRDARDRAWLAQVAAGGAQADADLQSLMQTHNGRLLGYLRRMRLDPDTAQDVIQKLWTELALKPLHCPADRVPLAWLVRVLRNRSRDFMAEHQREQGRRKHWRDQGDIVTTAPGPEDAVRLRQLVAGLDGLQGDDREALELVEGFQDRDWTIEDLATWRYEQCRLRHCECPTGARADCRRGTVSATRKAVSRARERLRKALRHLL